MALASASKKPQRIRFQYDRDGDVVIATVDWSIDTPADLTAWQQQYAEYFRTNFRHKPDVIFDLTHFTVNPKMSAAFGEARAKMLREYTSRSYRVGMHGATKVTMYTSSVIHGGTANNYASVGEALAALMADRASGKVET